MYYPVFLYFCFLKSKLFQNVKFKFSYSYYEDGFRGTLSDLNNTTQRQVV